MLCIYHIHLLMGTWVISPFLPLWIMLLSLAYILRVPVFSSFWHIFRNGIAGSYSYSFFSILRSHQINYTFQWVIYTHSIRGRRLYGEKFFHSCLQSCFPSLRVILIASFSHVLLETVREILSMYRCLCVYSFLLLLYSIINTFLETLSTSEHSYLQ